MIAVEVEVKAPPFLASRTAHEDSSSSSSVIISVGDPRDGVRRSDSDRGLAGDFGLQEEFESFLLLVFFKGAPLGDHKSSSEAEGYKKIVKFRRFLVKNSKIPSVLSKKIVKFLLIVRLIVFVDISSEIKKSTNI